MPDKNTAGVECACLFFSTTESACEVRQTNKELSELERKCYFNVALRLECGLTGDFAGCYCQTLKLGRTVSSSSCFTIIFSVFFASFLVLRPAIYNGMHRLIRGNAGVGKYRERERERDSVCVCVTSIVIMYSIVHYFKGMYECFCVCFLLYYSIVLLLLYTALCEALRTCTYRFAPYKQHFDLIFSQTQ